MVCGGLQEAADPSIILGLIANSDVMARMTIVEICQFLKSCCLAPPDSEWRFESVAEGPLWPGARDLLLITLSVAHPYGILLVHLTFI